MGLVGSNGSGKSTLLRLIAGVERPSHGEIEFFGKNLASSETIGSGTGAAIDAMALWPRWSVKRTLTYLGQLTGRTDEEVKDVIKSLLGCVKFCGRVNPLCLVVGVRLRRRVCRRSGF